MPDLDIRYDSQDEIPEPYRDLYSEADGKWKLTGVRGIKTSDDIARIQRALEQEKERHKETKARLDPWRDLDPEDVRGKLERFPELEAAAADKLDESKLEEAVSRRVEASLKGKIAPLEKKLHTLTEERDELARMRDEFVARDRTRRLHDAVRSKARETKMLSEAEEDALILAERCFDEVEGEFVTKDGTGVTPGCDIPSWFSEIQERRPHWWPESRGGGARDGRGGNGFTNNPWSADHWNLTEQGRVLREHGPDRARMMAESAGTVVGGSKPRERK